MADQQPSPELVNALMGDPFIKALFDRYASRPMPEEYDQIGNPLAPHLRAFGAGVVDPMGLPSWVVNRLAGTPTTDWYQRRMQEARDESPVAAGVGSAVLPSVVGLGGLRAIGELTAREAFQGFPFGLGAGYWAGKGREALAPPKKQRPQASYPPDGAY